MIHKITKPKRQSINITINLSNINSVYFNTNENTTRRKEKENDKVEGVDYEDLVDQNANPDQEENNEENYDEDNSGYQNTNEGPVPGDSGNVRNEDAIPKTREELICSNQIDVE